MDWLGALVLAVVMAGATAVVLLEVLRIWPGTDRTSSRPILVGQIYAVAGLAAVAWLALLAGLGVGTQVCVWTAVALVFIIRMIAIRRDWQLPRAMPIKSSSMRTGLARLLVTAPLRSVP